MQAQTTNLRDIHMGQKQEKYPELQRARRRLRGAAAWIYISLSSFLDAFFTGDTIEADTGNVNEKSNDIQPCTPLGVSIAT